jgi:hypothetical protein
VAWLAFAAAAAHLGAMQAAPIATPCVKVCIVDGESGLCLGCYRTLGEVAAWTRFSDAERAGIMTGLVARRGRIRPEKLAMIG